MKRVGLLLLFPLILIGLGYTLLRYLTCLVGNPEKGWSVALMVDETCNVDANGYVNTTISARAARAASRGRHWGCILCRVLSWVQPHHCDHALLDD